MNCLTKRFLSYVEIKTKITSIFAFLYTLAFLFYKKQPINWYLTGIFFASMFLFDLTTTAINNFIDTKTNQQTLQFERRTALIIIYVLLIISATLGLLLVLLTDTIVLILGGLCFLCGILYTYGPIPITRQPYGEVLSGIFYGFLIPFILLYINMNKDTFVQYEFSIRAIVLTLYPQEIVKAFLFGIVPICTTANIMLANNICDLQKDIAVRRYTLPYFLGDDALKLFAAIYYMVYIAIVVMVIAKILPLICLAVIITLLIVQKNINEFFKVQDKDTTFLFSIKNYIIIMGATTLTIFIGGFL